MINFIIEDKELFIKRLNELRGENVLQSQYDDPCHEWERDKNGEFLLYDEVLELINSISSEKKQ